MSDIAQETLERHEHLKHHPEDSHGKRAALIIGVLAATLAICEMAERSSQNSYLAHHIGASNEYAFYQARQNRSLVLNQTATILNALPSPTPESQKIATAADAEAKRLIEDSDRGNGAKQIQARAAAETAQRDHALHRYEWFEIVTSGLQIAIVLASVSVVTGLASVLLLGAGLGVAAAALAALVTFGVV
ncbi:DUF4337 family protein [Acidisphaera sp. L21]|jgi:hypothetical protein|uniref:DUF4337 family protein n=1 Tax=Acidisphaera sp. L21 TaxID=1641851 RepID=UPI00131C167A|nr:DUF4337 family protein [Acidisphaera sp. L21]